MRMKPSRLVVCTVAVCALVGGAAGSAAAQTAYPPASAGPSLNPCTRASLRLRCPDLVMSAPAHLEMDRSTQPGHVLLRAASSINNHGAGPLELIGHRRGSFMRVSQAIRDARGRRHLFATRAVLVFKHVPGDRYGGAGVGAYNYWKFRYAAGFSLWSVDATTRRAMRRVRVGPKHEYCFRDLFRTQPSGRSPKSAVYPACSTDGSLRQDTLGTSVGWSDVYPYQYPQQWIDVTGLRGRFAYVQTADPRRLLNESRVSNNTSETFIALPSGRVLGHRTAVSSP